MTEQISIDSETGGFGEKLEIFLDSRQEPYFKTSKSNCEQKWFPIFQADTSMPPLLKLSRCQDSVAQKNVPQQPNPTHLKSTPLMAGLGQGWLRKGFGLKWSGL